MSTSDPGPRHYLATPALAWLGLGKVLTIGQYLLVQKALASTSFISKDRGDSPSAFLISHSLYQCGKLYVIQSLLCVTYKHAKQPSDTK